MLLDIVFQSGEFFNEDTSSPWMDIFNTSVGAFIGSAATIGAVYLTFKKDRKKEDDKKIQFQIEKIKYFQSSVKNTIAKLKLQIASMEEFHIALDKNLLYIPILETQTFYELERIVHKINQEEYYHAYLGQFNDSNDTIEEFRKIYVALDYFEANLKLIKESLRKSIEFDYRRKKDLNNMGNKAMDMAAQMLVNKDIAHEKKLLEFVDGVIIKYYDSQTEKTDLKYLQEGFIDKMKPGLLKIGRHVTEANILVIELKNCTHLYYEIQLQNQEVSTDCKAWQKSLTDILSQFETISKRLIDYKV